MDLEASLEVMCSGVGLVLAAVGRPPHRRVDDVFGLVTDVEQSADLGEGQADPVAERRVCLGLVGVGGGVVGDVVGSGWFAVGCGSPFFVRCRCARTARKLCAIIARVMCRYQAW